MVVRRPMCFFKLCHIFFFKFDLSVDLNKCLNCIYEQRVATAIQSLDLCFKNRHSSLLISVCFCFFFFLIFDSPIIKCLDLVFYKLIIYLFDLVVQCLNFVSFILLISAKRFLKNLKDMFTTINFY